MGWSTAVAYENKVICIGIFMVKLVDKCEENDC